MKQFFGTCGWINKVKTIYYPDTGRINYAFVCYQNYFSAEKAKRDFNGMVLDDGRRMKVQNCKVGKEEACLNA